MRLAPDDPPRVTKAHQGGDPALARVLRLAREERGLAREALAFSSGLSTAALARIELGHSNPTWVTITAIADALELPLAELGARVDASRR